MGSTRTRQAFWVQRVFVEIAPCRTPLLGPPLRPDPPAELQRSERLLFGIEQVRLLRIEQAERTFRSDRGTNPVDFSRGGSRRVHSPAGDLGRPSSAPRTCRAPRHFFRRAPRHFFRRAPRHFFRRAPRHFFRLLVGRHLCCAGHLRHRLHHPHPLPARPPPPLPPEQAQRVTPAWQRRGCGAR